MHIYIKSITDSIRTSVFRIVLELSALLCGNSSIEIKDPRVGYSSRWAARQCSSLDDAESLLGRVPLIWRTVAIDVARGIPHSSRATVRRRNLIEHISDSLRRIFV